MKRLSHRFLPIDRYSRYQSNRIYRLTTPGLTERESAYLVFG